METHKTCIPIYSSDGGSLALLRKGKIFRIGEYLEGNFVLGKESGDLRPSSVLVWEFYPDGQKDFIFFDDDGKLLYASVSETRPDYIIRTYSDLVKKRANLQTWFNVVRTEFIIKELGF